MAGAIQPQAPTLLSDPSGSILSRTYRSLQITDTKSPIANQQSIVQGNRASTIKFDVAPEADSPSFTGGASPTLTPGAVYSLGIDGLSSPIRLAGKSIIGKSSADIASLMADRLTQLAPQRSLVGSALTLPSDLTQGSFSITIDGVQSIINFTRSRDAQTGNALANGTFTVSGDKRISVSMVPADPNDPNGAQKIILALPKSLSTTQQKISIAGSDAEIFGLTKDGVSEQILAAKSTTSNLESIQSILNEQFPSLTGSVSLTDDSRVLITRPVSGALSSLSLFPLSTTSEASRNAMSAIGFVGSDLTLSVSDKALTLTSQIIVPADSVPNLTDTSETVSRVGHKVTIASTQDGGSIPEDLLVSVQQNDQSGLRALAATYDKATSRINPVMPDIEAEVTDNGFVNLYALKLDASGNLLRDTKGSPQRGDLIAQRRFQSGIPIDYMGAQFVIDGNAAVGDTFRITTDPARTGDNRNALALIDIGRSDLLDKGSGTFADIYAAAVSKIGSSTQAAKTSASAAKTVADNVAAAYDSATGVNLDAEAAELIKLQQAYSACAQIVSTARDMFQMILKAF